MAKKAKIVVSDTSIKHGFKKSCTADCKKRIVFYFRKGVIAKGDFALYYRIAENIVNTTDYEVYCVNNTFEEIKKRYINSGIKFCDITNETVTLFENATFIVAYNQLFFLLEEIGELKNAKILLLFLHPQIFNWMSLQVSPHFNSNSVFKMLTKNNAYAFMDKANLIALQRHSSVKFEERYFPVVMEEVIQNFEVPTVLNKDEINIAWFGRLDEDKIGSLINFLDNLIGFSFGKPITIHLIGDGNAKDKIQMQKYAPQMRFVFNSYMYGTDKDEYLKNNADIVVAMGICALNAAALGLPTVLPEITSKLCRTNKYILFCDSPMYCLGTNAEDIDKLCCKTYTASDIIDLIYTEDNKRAIGEKCYRYAISNFTMECLASNYLRLIENTSLTVKQIKKVPSVSRQIRTFKLYKTIRKNRNYADFLQFRKKLNVFAGLSFKSKIKKVLQLINMRLH